MSTNNYRKCAKCGRTRIEDMTVSYHRFPNPGKTNLTKALAWAKYCWPNEDWTHASLLALHTSSKVLCGRHFVSSQFYDDKRQKLIKYAVPESTDIDEVLAEKGNIFKQNIEQSAATCVLSQIHYNLAEPSTSTAVLTQDAVIVPNTLKSTFNEQKTPITAESMKLPKKIS